MGEKNTMIPRWKLPLRIGVKLLAALGLFSLVVACLTTAVTRRIVADMTLKDLRQRLDLTLEMASESIDRSSLQSLRSRLSPDLSAYQVRLAESTAEYRKLFSQLSNIREVQPGLVLWSYLFAADEYSTTWRYLADLPDRGASNREGMNHFGKREDIGEWVSMINAMKQRRVTVNARISHDSKTGRWTLAGYAPVLDRDGSLLGVLGIDMDASGVRAVPASVFLLFLAAMLSALTLAFVISLFLGQSITHPLHILDFAVNRIREKEFGARVEVTGADENIQLAAHFNAMAETVQEHSGNLLRLKAAMERFVPEEFLGQLEAKDFIGLAAGDYGQKEMTVLSADIRSFAKISEILTPGEDMELLNSFWNIVAPAVRRFGGFVTQYTCDGVMALFPGTPEEGLRAAIEIQRRLREFNSEREKSFLAAVRVGIGLHCGEVILGLVGDGKRLEKAVISDAAAVASRLEEFTKVYKADIIIGRGAADRLENASEFGLRFLGRVKVKARTEAIDVLEVFDADPDDVRARKRRGAAEFEKAVVHFHDRKFRKAEEIFSKLLEDNPGDLVSETYRDECRRQRKT